MFEKQQTIFNITLPQPYPCRCGGTIFPIFRPYGFKRQRPTYWMGDESVWKKEHIAEGINEVIWKCDNCGKEIK